MYGAGLFVWKAKGPEGLPSFAATVVLGLAIASVIWTVLEHLHRRLGFGEAEDRSNALDFARPFRHWAAVASVAILALIALGAFLIPGSGPVHLARTPL